MKSGSKSRKNKVETKIKNWMGMGRKTTKVYGKPADIDDQELEFKNCALGILGYFRGIPLSIFCFLPS